MIEHAPARGESRERGVVAEGRVGIRAAGRFRLFRYEVRRWRDGVIPDVAEAVESPQRLTDDPERARRLLEAISPSVSPGPRVWVASPPSVRTIGVSLFDEVDRGSVIVERGAVLESDEVDQALQ